jgi:drug/metabolite transporter (DMT)-like permease
MNDALSPSRQPVLRGRVSPRAWTIFIALSLLWGAPYLLIKIAVDDGVPPGFVAWIRVVTGAAILLALAWKAGVLGQVRGRLRWVAAFALVEVVLPFPLISAAEQHVTSSLAAILIATSPLFVAVLAPFLDPSERVSGRRLVGFVTGLAGVAALGGVDLTGRNEWLGAAGVLAASVCYALGPIVYKNRLADLDRRASMGACLGLSVLLLAPVAAFDPPTSLPSTNAMAALLALGVLCTSVAFVLWGELIAAVGAGRALIVTYLNPLVAVGLGMALLGEHLTLGTAAGLSLILVGSWLAAEGAGH